MMRGATDPLPHRPRRVVVAGASCAGKTTLATRVAAALAIEDVELDGLHHGPDWTPRVAAFAARPAWVTEWQYEQVRALLAERTDLMVRLDLPRRTVMPRLVGRTIRRWSCREALRNGNREPGLSRTSIDPEHVVQWAWSSYHGVRARVRSAAVAGPVPLVVRLRSCRDVASWLGGPRAGAGGR